MCGIFLLCMGDIVRLVLAPQFVSSLPSLLLSVQELNEMERKYLSRAFLTSELSLLFQAGGYPIEVCLLRFFQQTP